MNNNKDIYKQQLIKPSKCCYNCSYCNYISGDMAQCILSPQEPIDIYIFETCNYFNLNKSIRK